MNYRLLLVASAAAGALAAAQPASFDVVIKNGRVLDGSGNPYVFADVGIRGDTIAAVGDLREAGAARIVDAAGQYVTPGFFTLHEHIEPAILKGYGALPNFTTQGFTSAVIDADGRSHVWPLTKQREELERAGSALNLVPMVGHGTVRGMAMGKDYMRPATAAEIEKMKALVRQGMEEGAFGLSAGLEYVPGRWSTEEEVLELAKAVAVYTNMHSYEAYDENIVLVPRWALVVRPVKGLGQYDSNHPEADYTGMRENLRKRLADPEQVLLIRKDIAYDIDRQGGPDGLLIMDYPDRSLIGKTLAQVAAARKEDPVETAIHFQMNGFDRPGGIQFRAFAVSLLDLEEFMRQDYTAVCTDREGDMPDLRRNRSQFAVEGAQPYVHPGTFGTVPRLLRNFVFEKRVITLPFAIRALTSLSAQILGLRDRGRLAEGQKADVVVFDPRTLRDKATYFEPFQYSEGINYVMVNGRFVVDAGKPTDVKPGRVLQRQRAASAATSQ